MPPALRAYAAESDRRGFDPEFTASVLELARDFEHYRADHGMGDPDAPPHRVDSLVALGLMRGTITLADILDTLRWCADRITGGTTLGEQQRTEARVAAILSGQKP